MPTIPTNRVRPGYGVQLAHTWIVAPEPVQRLQGHRRRGTASGFRRPARTGCATTYGFQFPQVFDRGRYDVEGIPRVSFSGTGAPAQIVGPSASLLSPTTDITFTNNLTWIKSAHTLRSGVIITRNRKDQNGRNRAHRRRQLQSDRQSATRPATRSRTRCSATSARYSEGGDDPLGFFRFTQYGGYVSDTWRARQNLSLEIGMRYEFQQPIYTQGNNITNFDPGDVRPVEGDGAESERLGRRRVGRQPVYRAGRAPATEFPTIRRTA